jgi:hypothetical protein
MAVSRFDRLLVATSHPALLEALREAGASSASSATDVERQLAEWEPLGLFVAQDLPGLTPEIVRHWSEQRPGRVALWLEPDPPPAWQSLGETAITWCGELDEAALAAWVASLGDLSAFEAGWQVGGILALRGGLGATRRALAWSRRLEALRGPGLIVDADWDCPDLTATVAPRRWQRGSATVFWPSEPAPIRFRSSWLLPAPPPWHIPLTEPTREQVEAVVKTYGRWVVVDLGRDPRRPVAARWLAQCGHLVVIAEDTDTFRLTHLLDLLRELNPQAHLGVAAPGRAWRHILRDAVMLPADWPWSAPKSPSGARPAAADSSDATKGGIPTWARRLSAGFNRFAPEKARRSPWGTWPKRLRGPSKPSTRK